MRSRALPANFDATQTLHSPLHDASRASMMSPIHRSAVYPDVGRSGPVSPHFQQSPVMESVYGPPTSYRPSEMSPTSPHVAYDQSQMSFAPVPRGSYAPGQQPSAGAPDVRMGYYSPQPTSHPSLQLYTGAMQMGPTSAPGGAAGTSAPHHMEYAGYGGPSYHSPGGTPVPPQLPRHRVAPHQGSVHGSQHGSQPGSPTHPVIGNPGGYPTGPWTRHA